MTLERIVLSHVNDTNDYQVLLRDDALAAAVRLGYKLEVQPAHGDAVAQIKDVYECIKRPPETRPRVLILFPVKDSSLERVLRDAANAGILCVVLNRRPEYIQTLRREFPQGCFGTIGPDQVEAGRLQGQHVRALLPAGGFFLYVMGPSAASAPQDRLKGLKDALQGMPFDWAQVHGDWSEESGERAVRQWLQVMRHADLQLPIVVSQNDAMAMGAQRALGAMAGEIGRPELTRTRLIGIDGHLNFGRRLVDEGKLAATIIQLSSGGPAVDWAARVLAGEHPASDVVLPLTPYPPAAQLAPALRVRP
jgi:ABC-type sugar transport system substrate-binding protein